jgi:hypothetical protein
MEGLMTHANRIDRRKALTIVAAAPAAVALGAGSALAGGQGGELAALVKRYFEQVEVFNATEHETDEQSDAHAEATFEATLDALDGVPVRTREDALAVLEFLERENVIEKWGQAEALVDALREYIASTGRVS